MLIMKFGGSSLADAVRIKDVVEIVSKRNKSERKLVVVVSAMKGVTDLLIQASQNAASGDQLYREKLSEIQNKHHQAIEALLSGSDEKDPLIKLIDEELDELGDILHGVELVRECSARTSDLISGFGERLNSKVVSATLRRRGDDSKAFDARTLVRTDDTHGRAVVDFEMTGTLVKSRLGGYSGIAVVTGFIASTEDGVATTLGRNGSDYTASILGSALDADSVEIWTDVDGVLTADPRVVKDAWVLDEISFQEAMELSYFGAEVIHPYTLVPVIEKEIPVYIKNTLNPSVPGTRIARNTKSKDKAITGIASIDDVAMVTIEGGGMVGMPGIAGKIFASVAMAGINIIMISQASSEHSICLVCRKDEARLAAEVLEKDLSDAISARMIRRIDVTEGLEIVAVIGENMKGRIGLSGRLFSSLGEAEINILAIAQGSSELNISFVIDQSQTAKALNAIHKTFIG